MADISDVEQAIVNLIDSVVYPNGDGQASALLNGSNAVVPARIYRGWPKPASLDVDVAAGTINISVFPRGSIERNTTRYIVDFQDVFLEVATVAAAAVDNKVTISGAPAVGVAQFVTVLVGGRVAVSYGVLNADTPASIAAALVTLLAGQGISAAAVGGVITVNSSAPLIANVGINGKQLKEIRRQQTQVLITLWCHNPAVRDNAAKLIEPVLAAATFLELPDTSTARFRYHGTVTSDEGQKVQVYRRDLIYDVEYATTIKDTATEVTAVGIGGIGAPNWFGAP
jgi:hypothetical protein